jgi:toxin-antitoxin system PIN domain toxin
MRSLLDANVLIALIDADHAFHRRAFSWFQATQQTGWATSPLTENACLRILSHPNYSGAKRFSLARLIPKLREIISKTNHEFWADNVSLLDDSRFEPDNILGPRQLTDVYLLALAVYNNGCLVSFDGRIPISAVRNSSAVNLLVI